MRFESCFWLIHSGSLAFYYKWYLIWKPWHVTTSCSQMQPDESWFVSTRDLFFLNNICFRRGWCALQTATMRNIMLPFTVEITAKNLVFRIRAASFRKKLILDRGLCWLKPFYPGTSCIIRTIEHRYHSKKGLIWGNMVYHIVSKYDERWWHAM